MLPGRDRRSAGASGETGEHRFDAGLHRIRGEILLKSDTAPAEFAVLAAIAVAQHQKAHSFDLRAALSLAKLYQSTGHSIDADDVLAPTLEGFSPKPEFPGDRGGNGTCGLDQGNRHTIVMRAATARVRPASSSFQKRSRHSAARRADHEFERNRRDCKPANDLICSRLLQALAASRQEARTPRASSACEPNVRGGTRSSIVG